MSGKNIFTCVKFPLRNFLHARHGMKAACFGVHAKASKKVEISPITHTLATGQVKALMEILGNLFVCIIGF